MKNLFIYLTFNPNPPNPELFVSKILDFSFEKEGLPPFTSGIDKPSCAFMPPYYFLKGKKDPPIHVKVLTLTSVCCSSNVIFGLKLTNYIS